jgi:hypothetical protein
VGRLLQRTSENASFYETVRKGLGGVCDVALGVIETVLCGSFWLPYIGKIHGRSLARTPFRTVSMSNFIDGTSSNRVSANFAFTAFSEVHSESALGAKTALGIDASLVATFLLDLRFGALRVEAQVG